MADAADDPEIDSIVQGLSSPDGSQSPASSATTSQGGSDPEISSILAGVTNGAPASSHAAPQHVPNAVPHPTHPPTRFQQAVAPPPVNQPEPTWGQVAGNAVHNFLPSLGGVAQGIGSAILHPIKTAETIGQVGSGLVSQAEGALGVQQDPQQAAKAQSLARALEHHYAQTYGSVKGFKQAVSTDPASILMDASTLLGGTGAAADAAGLARTAGLLGKVGSAVDPVANALRVASLPVKAVSKVAPAVQQMFSGASARSLALAAKVGADANPAAEAAFRAHLTGQANPTDIVDTAQRGLASLAADRSANYVAGRDAITNGPLPSIPWQPVQDALQSAQASTRITDPATGVSAVVNQGANEALGKIQQQIDFYSQQPTNSIFSNLNGFDALKRSIGDIRNSYKSDPVAYQKATQMYNAVGDAIKQAHPDYADLMSDYSDASDQLSQIRSTFGLKNGAQDELVLRRLLNSKTSDNKQNLLSQLADKEPTLPYMLAGHELNPAIPQGLRQIAAPLAAAATGAVNPLLAAGQFAMSSPRIMGSLNYRAGKAAGLANKLTQPALRQGAYYAGRADQEADGSVTPSASTPALPIAATSNDTDAATRMVLGEAGNQSDTARLAALFTAINRAHASGKSLSDVIAQPNAYEAVTSGKTNSLDSSSPLYQYVHDNIVVPALSGKLDDPTGGMTHFINKKLQLQLGRKIPGWAQGEGLQIGDHTFYAAGGRVGRASGGRTDLSEEQLIQRLMDAAETAKKEGAKITKPLLSVPDSAVAKALSLANQAA